MIDIRTWNSEVQIMTQLIVEHYGYSGHRTVEAVLRNSTFLGISHEEAIVRAYTRIERGESPITCHGCRWWHARLGCRNSNWYGSNMDPLNPNCHGGWWQPVNFGQEAE